LNAKDGGMGVDVVITEHAQFEASRRNIPEELIKSAVETPQQKLSSKKGRVIVQKKYYDETEGKEMILRVVGIESVEEFRVITVYKTSKIDKYWKEGG